MENPILQSKKELIHWMNTLDDLEVIAELLDLKEKRATAETFSEPQTEYLVKDDFDERFAKGMSGEELMKRVYAHIETLPWKEK